MLIPSDRADWIRYANINPTEKGRHDADKGTTGGSGRGAICLFAAPVASPEFGRASPRRRPLGGKRLSGGPTLVFGHAARPVPDESGRGSARYRAGRERGAMTPMEHMEAAIGQLTRKQA